MPRPLSTRLLHRLGLVLIGLSMVIFLLTLEGHSLLPGWLDLSGFFWLNYGLSVAYFIVVGIHYAAKPRPRRLDPVAYVRSLTLFSLSAHTLNYGTDLQVFAPYVDWMVGYVIGMHIVLLLLPHRQAFSAWGRACLYAGAGAGLVLAVYLTLFLGPLILIAFPVVFVFGVSLHATVPLWFTIVFVRLPWQMEKTVLARRAFWGGVGVPILVLAIFMGNWYHLQRSTEAAATRWTTEGPAQGLPAWAIISQYLPDGLLAQRVLMSDLFAQRSFWDLENSLTGLGNRRIRQQHDPLATTARVLYGPLDLDPELRVRLLDYRYAARHLTHRRLWRDTDLFLARIHTRVHAYPAYRLAYLEHELEIANGHPNPDNQQEAVFTFHLPEGATVTTLSLWVAGEERPARLTTRSRADSAYQTIVGQERRDPALLHWQEGNRVTLTVFPCTPAEARRVKLGIALPLAERDDRLHLHNVWLEGPPTEQARAEVTLTVAGAAPAPHLPHGWRATDRGWRYRGDWHPTWRVSWPRLPLASEGFHWRGERYYLAAATPEVVPFRPEAIYVDLHGGWSAFQWERLWSLIRGAEVYVLLPEAVRVTEANVQEVFAQAQARTFTLLPLPSLRPGSLVITQSPATTPQLSDLDDTPYAQALQAWLAQPERALRLWELGDRPAPYLRSLREFRALDLRQGRLPALAAQLEAGTWPAPTESAQAVALPGTSLLIHRETAPDTPPVGAAPDHLARLYHYQDLLRTIGTRYFERAAHEEAWLDQARDAYVISPVASLVVLETEADYDRFGIEATPEDSLGPVTLPKEAGAAPEPHEWALLALLLIFLGGFYRRRYLRPA